MKLFTKEIDAKLFAQYSKGGDLANQMVVAKIFNPYGRGTWYLLNSDPDDPDYIWAIVDLFEPETGSVSRSELESIKVPPFRLGLERDTSFKPINAQELLNGLYQGKHYAKGGNISYTDWEEGVAESLADKLEISYNDAQGIIEANEFYMAQAWGKGLNSEEAADYIDSKTSMAQGGSIGSEYESDVQVKESEGVNYLVPRDAEDGDIVVALAKGGAVSEELKNTDYISNRKIDAVIIDGKRYDGRSIIDGVYLRKSANATDNMPMPVPQAEPIKSKPLKTIRKPLSTTTGGELLNSKLAENDAQTFESKFGVSVKIMAEELKGYDNKSVLRGDAWKTYESISGKELERSEVETFFKTLLGGFSYYDIKLGKSKAIVLPSFEDDDSVFGVRINVKPQYKKPLSENGFLSLKNIVGTDTLRTIMSCVYFDDGNLVATDSWKIVIIKKTQSDNEIKEIVKNLTKKDVNKFAAGKEADKIIDSRLSSIFDGGLNKKAINMFSGELDSQNYPNYQAVIPKNIEYTESVSIQSLIDACNGVFEVVNNCYKAIGNIRFDFINGQEQQEIAFNSEYLLETLQVLQVNGAKSVKLSPSSPTRGCGIYADNGNYALIMPVMINNNAEMICNYSIPMPTKESQSIPSDSLITKFKFAVGGNIYMAKGGSFGRFFNEAKESAKSKTKDIKRNIALDVMDDTRKKLSVKRDINSIRAASELVDNKYAKGGIIKSIEKGNEYRYLPNSSIEKDILAKVDYIVNKTKFAGNFSFKNYKHDTWIYFLDDFDRNLVKDIPLKLTERIYRSITRTAAISGISSLVKINLENGLVYYLEDAKAEMDEIEFVRKGEQTAYLNLVQVEDDDYYKLGGKTPMAKGGKIATFKEGDVVKSKDPKDGYGTITEVVGNVALVDFEDKFSNHMRRLSFSDLKKVSSSQFNNRFQSSTYMKPKRGWSHKSK